MRHSVVAPDDVVALGDAENDHAFLSICSIGVAVSNALPMLKERAGLVTQRARGAGVIELIERILATACGAAGHIIISVYFRADRRFLPKSHPTANQRTPADRRFARVAADFCAPLFTPTFIPPVLNIFTWPRWRRLRPE
jgi:hypothetical protein